MRFYRTVRARDRLHPALLERGFWIVATYRLGAWASRLRTPIWGRIVRMAYWMLNLAVSTITGADIRSGAIIGQRFWVHTFRGLLITNGVRIGDNCIVNAGVCLVHRADGRGRGVPTVGNHVQIGLGAKILGNVTIDDHSVVGANAVVIKDVPLHHLAVGVPAVNKLLKPPEEPPRKEEAQPIGQSAKPDNPAGAPVSEAEQTKSWIQYSPQPNPADPDRR